MFFTTSFTYFIRYFTFPNASSTGFKHKRAISLRGVQARAREKKRKSANKLRKRETGFLLKHVQHMKKKKHRPKFGHNITLRSARKCRNHAKLRQLYICFGCIFILAFIVNSLDACGTRQVRVFGRSSSGSQRSVMNRLSFPSRIIKNIYPGLEVRHGIVQHSSAWF